MNISLKTNRWINEQTRWTDRNKKDVDRHTDKSTDTWSDMQADQDKWKIRQTDNSCPKEAAWWKLSPNTDLETFLLSWPYLRVVIG